MQFHKNSEGLKFLLFFKYFNFHKYVITHIYDNYYLCFNRKFITEMTKMHIINYPLLNKTCEKITFYRLL